MRAVYCRQSIICTIIQVFIAIIDRRAGNQIALYGLGVLRIEPALCSKTSNQSGTGFSGN
jgi:hypothetical protein